MREAGGTQSSTRVRCCPPGTASPHVVHPVVVQPETVGAVGPVDQQLKVLPDAESKRRTGDSAPTDSSRPRAPTLPTPFPPHTHFLFPSAWSYYFAIFSNITRVSSSVKGRIFPLGYTTESACLRGRKRKSAAGRSLATPKPASLAAFNLFPTPAPRSLEDRRERKPARYETPAASGPRFRASALAGPEGK